MKVVQLTQKDVQVGLIMALYSADNAVKSIDSAKYTILYSAANGYFQYNSAGLKREKEESDDRQWAVHDYFGQQNS